MEILRLDHVTLDIKNRRILDDISFGVAAGDIVGPPYQMAKSVGEGCVAGMEAAGYARRRKKAE